LALAICLPQAAGRRAQTPLPTFGTTVVIPSGLTGKIYKIHRNTKRLPDFARLKPIGTIYTDSLNVPPQDFKGGFPGVTKRFEWFAIDYSGRFWIEAPGLYRFALLSDDGSRLYVDGQLVIDNDGQHPPEEREQAVYLSHGVHTLRVAYFQGPRFQVALVLRIARPEQPFEIFSTDVFKPPPGVEKWPPQAGSR
jgi:hypothetical protein